MLRELERQISPPSGFGPTGILLAPPMHGNGFSESSRPVAMSVEACLKWKTRFLTDLRPSDFTVFQDEHLLNDEKQLCLICVSSSLRSRPFHVDPGHALRGRIKDRQQGTRPEGPGTGHEVCHECGGVRWNATGGSVIAELSCHR